MCNNLERFLQIDESMFPSSPSFDNKKLCPHTNITNTQRNRITVQNVRNQEISANRSLFCNRSTKRNNFTGCKSVIFAFKVGALPRTRIHAMHILMTSQILHTVQSECFCPQLRSRLLWNQGFTLTNLNVLPQFTNIITLYLNLLLEPTTGSLLILWIMDFMDF